MFWFSYEECALIAMQHCVEHGVTYGLAEPRHVTLSPRKMTEVFFMLGLTFLYHIICTKSCYCINKVPFLGFIFSSM